MNSSNIPYILIQHIIKTIYKKHHIFVSSINIQEFPNHLQIIFTIYPIELFSYKAIATINKFIKSLISIIYRKNVNIYIRLTPHLLSNVDILSE